MTKSIKHDKIGISSNKIIDPLGAEISNWEGKLDLPEAGNDIDLVSIRCLKPMIVRITGKVTGTKYIFHGAGSIIDVDARDVESIMSRNKRIQSCCGSFSSPYFETL